MKTIPDTIKYDFHLPMDNPFLVKCTRSSGKRFITAPDMHYPLHFGVVLAGSLEIIYDNYRATLNTGDICFTAQWEPHAIARTELPNELLMVSILPEKLGDIGFAKLENWLLPFIVSVPERPQTIAESMRSKVIHLAGEIKEAANRNDQHGDILCWLKLHELLLYIIENSGFENRPDAKIQNVALERILPAIQLVRQANKKLVTLDEAANVCFLGKSRFCDLFKTAMGTTFGKFSSRVRLGAAAAEIAKTSFPVKEIADSWGFYDESHFCRIFKKYFYCSPSEFRRKKEYTDEQYVKIIEKTKSHNFHIP